MNILFYVEPLIELGKPNFKSGWINYFTNNIIKSLLHNSSLNYNFTIILSEELFPQINTLKDVNYILINQQELLDDFPNYKVASTKWFKNSFNQSELESYVNLFKNKLSTKNIELIFTYTHIPFLQKIYPKAMVLHMEYALFSRSPFPESWHFDHAGVSGGGIGKISNNTEYIENLKNRVLNKKQLELIFSFKSKIKSLISQANPYAEIISNWKSSYKKLIFVPLQFSEFYIFDSQCKYANQFDFAYDVLRNTPTNYGVIFCEHPSYPIFSKDTLSFFENKFTNFLFTPLFPKFDASGQYILSQVDLVITVSSSIGLQTLIWDIPVISLGKNHLSFIKDGSCLSEIDNAINNPKKNKDNILHWLITRYCVTDFLISKPGWLEEYLQKRLKSPNHYPLLMQEVEYFKLLESSIKTNIPCKKEPNEIELLLIQNQKLKEEKSNLSNQNIILNKKLQKIYDTKIWKTYRLCKKIFIKIQTKFLQVKKRKYLFKK